MYAQMVYKDRKIMELNSTILEQDQRVMDLQEFAEEKDQVIRGRNKVVEVGTFKGQNIQRILVILNPF